MSGPHFAYLFVIPPLWRIKMQADQIKFVTNKFESFTAKKSFSLGVTEINIVEGGEVLFDGSVVIINDQRIPYPNLRGAVKMGWLVPTSEYDVDSVSVPASANIQVRSAVGTQQNSGQPASKSMISTVQSDERIVMSQGQRKEMREMTTMKRTSSSARTEGNAGSAHEGVVVNRVFKTPARSETKLTAETAGAAIHEVSNIKIEPGEGLSESQYLDRLSDEEREEYIQKKELAKAVHVAELEGKGLHFAKINTKTGGTKTTDGITSTVTTGGGTEIADLSGLDTVKAESSSMVVEGMTFKNLNGPKRAFQASVPAPVQAVESKIGKDGTADMRKRIAKTLCSDFPENYSFDDHWKRRLARLRLDYSERHDVLQAVFAAESDDFKRILLEEFPEAFGAVSS
jgi:hypothetical protein